MKRVPATSPFLSAAMTALLWAQESGTSRPSASTMAIIRPPHAELAFADDSSPVTVTCSDGSSLAGSLGMEMGEGATNSIPLLSGKMRAVAAKVEPGFSYWLTTSSGSGRASFSRMRRARGPRATTRICSSRGRDCRGKRAPFEVSLK